jgi:hypothetical protein
MAQDPAGFVADPAGFEPDVPAGTSTPSAPKPTILQQIQSILGTNAPVSQVGIGPEADLLKGAVKGAVNTARNVAGVVLPKGWQEGLSALRQRMGLPSVASMTEPTDTAQAIGKGAEQVGEFLIPGALVEHMLPAANLALKMGTLGTANAALARLQGAGSVGTTAAGVLGAAGPALEATATQAAPALANKVETALLKPTQADIRHGFQVSNIFKHDVGGTLTDTLNKTTAKIQQLGQQLQSVLGTSPTTVDIGDAINAARTKTMGNAARQFGQNAAISKAFDSLEGDLHLLTNKGTAVDLVEANHVKQAIGDLGAWANGLPDRESNALEQASNALYSELKTRIEQAATPGAVKAINDQLSELIPIRSAVFRRIPIEARQEVLRLGDMLGLVTGHVPVSLIARMMHSGQVANLLASAPTVLPATQAVAGAAAQLPGGQ